MLKNSQQQISVANEQIKESQAKIVNFEKSVGKVTDEVLEKRVSLALLEFKRANAIVNLKEIEKSLKEAQENLATTVLKAEQSGERIAVLKSSSKSKMKSV